MVPRLRGNGLGRTLLETAMEIARAEGADHIELNTSETDVAARGLYESVGFTNREGGPDGPIREFRTRVVAYGGLPVSLIRWGMGLGIDE